MTTTMMLQVMRRVAAALMCWTTPGLCRPVALATTRTPEVCDIDEPGTVSCVKYERGTFIYRLAGRDGGKEASYYTAGADTLSGEVRPEGTAPGQDRFDDILTLQLCEPAMGSAAFLNEAINQLAEKYLELKQAELGRRIPHEAYP